jgi:hypothetical protein
MSTTLSSLFGGGSGVTLAPDLDWPSSAIFTGGIQQVTFNPQGSLTEALGLTGKYAIFGLSLNDMTAETVTVKLTVDGIVIWNDVGYTSITEATLYGDLNNATKLWLTPFICNSSLSLEVQTQTDTSVTLKYLVKAIV